MHGYYGTVVTEVASTAWDSKKKVKWST